MKSKMINLMDKLTRMVIEELSLEGVNPVDLEPDEQLFGEGLGLDSIDALALIFAINRDFGVQIEKPEMAREILTSIRTIAMYIVSKTPDIANL